MIARRALTDFTNLFSPNNFFKKWWYNFKLFNGKCLKMVECDSHETRNIYPNLSLTLLNDQQQFWLNIINEVKDYFVAEIKDRELVSKRLSKYIASFDYFDKSLICLWVTTSSISIASFATVIGEVLVLLFQFSAGIVKQMLKTTRNKKKKHNKIVMLARSKFNSIKSKISEELITNEISHEDFMIIINEEKIYLELKKALEWWIVKEVMLKKLVWLKKVKK